MKLSIQLPRHRASNNGSDFEISAEPEMFVADLKAIIQAELGIPLSSQTLIYKNVKLQDNKPLSTYSLPENCAITLEDNCLDKNSNFSTKKQNFVENNIGKEKSASQLENKLEAKPEREISINEKSLKETVGNVSRDYFDKLMHENKDVKNIMESNPELNQIISDPNMLKDNLEIVSNPALLNELMRNKDRVIQNAENHPEGFNVLHRMYNSVEEPLHDAMKGSFMQKSFKNTEKDRSVPDRFSLPSDEEIPDPWNVSATNSRIFGNNNWMKQKVVRTVLKPVNKPKQQNSTTSNQSTLDPTVRFRTQLQQLQSMGFNDRQSNIRALIATEGNLEAAVNLLLS